MGKGNNSRAKEAKKPKKGAKAAPRDGGRAGPEEVTAARRRRQDPGAGVE